MQTKPQLIASTRLNRTSLIYCIYRYNQNTRFKLKNPLLQHKLLLTSKYEQQIEKTHRTQPIDRRNN